MRYFLKVTGWVAGGLIACCILAGAGFLFFSSAAEFRPPAIQPVPVPEGAGKTGNTPGKDVFSVMTWNIGYAGLGREMDFFYDGGKKVRPPREYFDTCCRGILGQAERLDTLDVLLFQEVDVDARRSYYRNEMTMLETGLPAFHGIFAVNYDCRFVPVPLFEPMGQVTSGIAMFSSYRPESAIRHGFLKHSSWPERLFDLKRCFLECSFRLSGNRRLIVLNIHNDAFDTRGILRRHEMDQISQVMKQEYARGNYVVAGGDWNANPPGFSPSRVTTGDKTGLDTFPDLSTWLPDWIFAFDATTPTNRSVDMPYEKGKTGTSVIDFFIVSPNVEILETRTIPTGFLYSDHQPVFVKFRLK